MDKQPINNNTENKDNFEFVLTEIEINESKKHVININLINRILLLSFYPIIILFITDFIVDFNFLIFISIILTITTLRYIIRAAKIKRIISKCNIANAKTQIELTDNQLTIKVKNGKFRENIKKLLTFSIPNFNVIYDQKRFYFLIPKNEITNSLCSTINTNILPAFWKYIPAITIIFIFFFKTIFSLYNISNPYSEKVWRIEELKLSGEFLKDYNFKSTDSLEALLDNSYPFTLPISGINNLSDSTLIKINFRFEPINKIRILSIILDPLYDHPVVISSLGRMDYLEEDNRIKIEQWEKDSCIVRLVLKNIKSPK